MQSRISESHVRSLEILPQPAPATFARRRHLYRADPIFLAPADPVDSAQRYPISRSERPIITPISTVGTKDQDGLNSKSIFHNGQGKRQAA